MSVTLTTAKLHLRVSGSGEDTIITAYLANATAWIERFTGKKLSAGAVSETFTEFGDYLELSWGPANTLTTIAYTDAEGEAATVSGARLQDGKVYPPTAGWPGILAYSTITVTYNAGYSTTPPELEQAQLLLAGHFYMARDENAPVPVAVDALCRPFRTPTLR